jgi:hypothetical protein
VLGRCAGAVGRTALSRRSAGPAAAVAARGSAARAVASGARMGQTVGLSNKGVNKTTNKRGPTDRQ